MPVKKELEIDSKQVNLAVKALYAWNKKQLAKAGPMGEMMLEEEQVWMQVTLKKTPVEQRQAPYRM